MSPTTPPELCEALLSTNEQEAGEADKAAEACGGQAVGEEGAGGPSHGSVTLLEIAAEPTLANFMQATTALCKVILGTTMLVLPKTFELLGCVLGSLLITAVSALTWFTLHGLMHGAAQADRRTYPSLVRALYGRPAYWGLTLAIIANCLGLCLVTVLMLCDCLLGAEPEHSAILQALFPGLDFSAPFLQRPWVLAYVLLAVLTPLSLSRDLTQLSRLAAAGVAGVGLFAAATILLAGVAAWQGELQPPPLWPDWERLVGPAEAGGEEGAGSGAEAGAGWGAAGAVGWQWLVGLYGVLNVVPVLLNADICHQAVFPLASLLQPYSLSRFDKVTAVGLVLCNTLYITIAWACLAAFGRGVDTNVLNDMTASAMAPLLGAQPAALLALLVRLMFFVSLLGSFVLNLHPLRHCCMEVLGDAVHLTHKKQLERRLFVPLTLLLLALVLLLAIVVPGLWLVVSLIGSVACTFLGFIFPGLVIMRTSGSALSFTRCLALVVILIGTFLFVNGFSVLFSNPHS